MPPFSRRENGQVGNAMVRSGYYAAQQRPELPEHARSRRGPEEIDVIFDNRVKAPSTLA